MATKEHESMEQEFGIGIFPFDVISRHVREHPIQSMLAFGIGIGLGVVLVVSAAVLKQYEARKESSS